MSTRVMWETLSSSPLVPALVTAPGRSPWSAQFPSSPLSLPLSPGEITTNCPWP